MEQEQRDQIRSRIEVSVSELHEKIRRMEDDTTPIAPENSIGRVSRMDAINNKSVTEAALRSAKSRLNKLKVALANLDQPGFGICSLCRQPIPEPRLLYMPESTRCVRCADR